MTERAEYSRLHGITLPLESKVGGSTSGFKTQLRSGNQFPHETTNPLIVNVEWHIEDENTVLQLKQLGKGEINIVQLNCLNFDELVHVQNIRGREIAGRVTQWQVQGEFNLVGINWNWVIDGEEIVTGWDTIVSDSFTQVSTVGFTEGNEGLGDAPDDYTWRAQGGNWAFGSSDYFYAGSLNGRTHAISFVVEDNANGYDYPGTADGKFQVRLRCFSTANASVGLVIRDQWKAVSSYSYCYVCYADHTANTITFAKNTGSATTALRTWVVDDFINNVWYTLKVIARGNRFDVFWRGEWLGKVYDETYTAGWHGCMSNNINNVLDDWTWEIAKPVIGQLPVGAYDINQPLPHRSKRMNDNMTADGYCVRVFDPINPISFKQRSPKVNDRQTTLLLVPEQAYYQSGYYIDGSGNNFTYSTLSTLILREEETGTIVKKVLYAPNTAISTYFGIVQSDGTFSNQEYRTLTIECLFRVNKGFTVAPASNRYAIFAGWNSWNPGAQKGISLCTYNQQSTWMIAYGDGVNYTEWSTGWAPEADVWYFVTIVIDLPNDEISFYVDGVLKKTATPTYDRIVMEDNHEVYLFRAGINDDYIAASLGYLRFDRTALTAAEVKERYEYMKLNDSVGGEVKIWDTMGENGFWHNMEAYMPMNEGRGLHVHDHSKYCRTPTEGSWLHTPGAGDSGTDGWARISYNKHAETCYHFDGANDYLYCALGGEDIDKHGWTIGGWFKCDTNGAQDDMMCIRDSTAGGGTFYFLKNTSNQILIQIQGSTWGTWDSQSFTLTSGRWYFIVVTWDGKEANDPILYVDGEAKALNETSTLATPGRDADQFCVATLYAGANANNFDGFIDDPFCFSIAFTAERIRWMYENMPLMVDESKWFRVTDSNHPFIGDMIIDNGIIRVCKNYRITPQLGSNYWNMIGIMHYVDGMWMEEPIFFLEYYDATLGHWMGDDVFKGEIGIKELKKHRVVLTQFIENGDAWLQHELYVIAGLPMLNIKIVDWSLSYNLRTSSFTGNNNSIREYAYDIAPRFSLPTLDRNYDSDFSEAAQGYEHEGLILAFSPEGKCIWMYWDQVKGDGYGSYDGSSYTVMEIYKSDAIDVDVDKPPHWWGFGLLPYKTNNLHMDTDRYVSMSSAVIEADSNCANGYRFSIEAQYGYVRGYFDEVKGSFRAYIRARGSAACNINWGIYNQTDTNWPKFMSSTLDTSYDWYGPFDFVIDDDLLVDDIVMCVENSSDGPEAWIDEIVVWPISNGKNFPLDIRNQALMIPDITELGG